MFEVIILTVIPELTQKDFDALLPLVSLDKQERIKQFHFFLGARNCLLGDILARVEISRYTDLSMKQIDFSVNEYGKPFIVGKVPIQFNISHSGNYIACAITGGPVGVDIELIKTADMQIAKRFFTTDETAYIMDGHKINRFYEVWTKKESRIKWEGMGLHKPLPSFSVFKLKSQEQLTYHNVFQNNKAICHVCSTNQKPSAVRIIDTTEFVNSIVSKLKYHEEGIFTIRKIIV